MTFEFDDKNKLRVCYAVIIIMLIQLFIQTLKRKAKQKEKEFNERNQIEFSSNPDDNNNNDNKTDNNDDILHSEPQEFIPLPFYKRLKPEESVQNSLKFYEEMKKRRSVRNFSSDPIPSNVIDNIIATAGTSPSGANCQPWVFVVVQDLRLKQQIRAIVEEEEKVNYERRMARSWVKDLEKIGTDWRKEYLETAPALIIVMKQIYGEKPDGSRQTNYYYELSSGIACGVLVTAIHHAGLVTLTSTPMNCGPKLTKLLERPANEKVLLLLPIGYPAADATVPNIGKKPLDEILKKY